MTKKMLKVCLVDENDNVEVMLKDDTDFFDASSKSYLQFRMQFVEIGWAEIEQMAEGRLELKMTLIGNYIVGDSLAPDMAEFRGTIPTSLRKG
jgi:hypothetical protein